MADFNITVDTNEMARSIDSVNRATVAVTAMEAAVVHAQNQAAKDICQNVDYGFYMLMRSQLSQKMAAVSSEMFSKQQLLETFKNDLNRIMLIMQDDYNRIKQRYLRHFTALDKALETRVHELDKRAYNLSKNYKASLFKSGNEVIKTLAFNDETQTVNVQETGALVKNKSAKTIGAIAENVMESVAYSKQLHHILNDEDISASTEEYVPVLMVESDSMFAADSSLNNYYVSDNESLPDSTIINNIQAASGNFTWKEVEQKNYESIKNSFLTKCNESGLDERVIKEMIRLFESSKWQEASEGDSL